MRELKRPARSVGFNKQGLGMVLLARRREWETPALRATMPLAPWRSHWPLRSEPQAATVPSARRARLWAPPAATATTLLKPAGREHWPEALSPQAMTVPSNLRARL